MLKIAIAEVNFNKFIAPIICVPKNSKSLVSHKTRFRIKNIPFPKLVENLPLFGLKHFFI